MAEEENGEKKVSLVKIDSELYDKASEIVKLNPIDYPSIKNFVEVSVRDQINAIRYNVENMKQIVSKDGKLVKKKSDERYTNCLVCDKIFLAPDVKGGRGKVCKGCRERILKLAEKLGDNEF